MLTLVLGGARSGKSRHAESLVTAGPGPWHYIATARRSDDEMAARIDLHQQMRVPGWTTHEEPLAAAQLIAKLPEDAPVLLDCLTLWLTNQMLSGADVVAEAGRLEQAVAARAGATVLVANEVGLGIVPVTPLGRAFRDEAGRLNQRLAARADRVLFMVAGLPMTVK